MSKIILKTVPAIITIIFMLTSSAFAWGWDSSYIRTDIGSRTLYTYDVANTLNWISLKRDYVGISIGHIVKFTRVEAGDSDMAAIGLNPDEFNLESISFGLDMGTNDIYMDFDHSDSTANIFRMDSTPYLGLETSLRSTYQGTGLSAEIAYLIGSLSNPKYMETRTGDDTPTKLNGNWSESIFRIQADRPFSRQLLCLLGIDGDFFEVAGKYSGYSTTTLSKKAHYTFSPFNYYLGASYLFSEDLKADLRGYVSVGTGFINGYILNISYLI